MTGEKTGLILVTGATGSGKTTTLAALLNEFNEKLPGHIVTLEDPIEFVHPHKTSTFCQRELGNDFSTFAVGLRAALREAPKVIFVGELRDRETTEIAITAAETGHLVVSTLHTINAGQSINRILGMFEQAEQGQMRQRLAETLRYIVAQRLAPKIGGGRAAPHGDSWAATCARARPSCLARTSNAAFYDITAASATYGWQTFDQSIMAAFKADADRGGDGHGLRLAQAGGRARDRPAPARDESEVKEFFGLRMSGGTPTTAPAAAPPPVPTAPAAPMPALSNVQVRRRTFLEHRYEFTACASRSRHQSQVANNQEDKIGRDDRSALLCCHEPTYLEYLTGQLRGMGYKVHHAKGHQAAVQAAWLPARMA